MPDADLLRRMNGVLSHRGPDDDGARLFLKDHVAVGLGHRRLSIIDPASGRQPMSNEDESVCISYNGEVYNHLELRCELKRLGHRFRTRCDTETVLHAYEEWGRECVHRFQGMFAFVVWDARKNQMFGARDRLGIKPFYYVACDGTLVCASEAKALLATGWCSAELNLHAIPEFVTFGFLAGEQTLFRNVKNLPPGHWLTWSNGKLTTSRYWEIPAPTDGAPARSENDYIDEFLSLFRQSVRQRLMSDVPLGVFLSGGLDSSAIAVTMAEQMSSPVKTFSVGFESGYYSEFDFAREVAAAIGAEHHEIVLKPQRAFTDVPRLIWHEDEPIRFSASVALYVVSKLASEHVKVVLTGEGSDELFAGYERYWATLFNLRWGSLYQGAVPAWIRRPILDTALRRLPLPPWARTKISHTFLHHSLRPQEIIFDNWYAIFAPRVHRQLFSPEVWNELQSIDPYHTTMGLYHQRTGGDALDQMLYTDQKTYLVELLRKQDKMSMAASLESRVPFLDHRLVEFAARLPSRMKLRGTSGKYIVKRALQSVIPTSILNRKKMGFPIPLDQWFRHEFHETLRSVLLSDRARDRGLFNQAYVHELVSKHMQGAVDNTERLWTLLNFELWARIFLDQEGPSSVSDELASPSSVSGHQESAELAS